MTQIRLAKDLDLPAELVTRRNAIVGQTGSGKSTTSSRMVEEIIRIGAPVCIIDPTGGWYGLKYNKKGTGPGLGVIVLGGEHADEVLSPGAGAVMAEFAANERQSMILDVSEWSKDTQQRFGYDFSKRLLVVNRKPLHVVYDEADIFAPQNPMPDERLILNAIDEVQRRARRKGIGTTMISQRPAVLHKNIMSQVDMLIIQRVVGPHDRKAIVGTNGWLGNSSGIDADSLSGMETGEAIVWSPSWLKLTRRVSIFDRTTFDSSATPELDADVFEPKNPADVDLAGLRVRIAATIEEHKKTDPTALAQRNDELAEQVAKFEERLRLLGEQLTEARENAMRSIDVTKLQTAIDKALLAFSIKMDETVEHLRQATARVTADISQSLRDEVFAAARPERTGDSPRDREIRGVLDEIASKPFDLSRPGRGMPPVVSLGSGEGDPALGPCPRKLLTALAQYELDGLSKGKMILLAGYRDTGSISEALALLRSKGYIVGGAEHMKILPEGKRALGKWTPLPTGPDLVEYWLEHVSKIEGAILRVMLTQPRRKWTLDEILSRTKSPNGVPYKNTGSVSEALATLRKLDLVEGSSKSMGIGPDLLAAAL